MTEYNPAQQQVIDLLGRGDESPVFAPDLAQSLRADLEEAIAPLAPQLGGEPLWISKHALSTVHGCEANFVASEGSFAWSVPSARGTVAHKAIELSVHWRGDAPPSVLVDEALARLAEDDRSLARFLQSLEEAERAQLRADTSDLAAKFLECFPTLRASWWPVTESKVRVELLGGLVVLAGKVDLTLGRPERNVATKVIIDLKSGRALPGHRDDLRFYALIETLRLGVPPRMLATYELDTARAHQEAVTTAVLEAAVRRTAAGVARIVALLRNNDTPAVRPGAACRWCPLKTTCPEGMVHLEESGYDRL
jgi:RecB family exonuclease